MPLDPAYPAERLRFMLEDSAASVIVTQEELLPTLPETASHLLCLDRDWRRDRRAALGLLPRRRVGPQ